MTELIKGTEVAVLLTLGEIDGYNACQYEWKVELYTNPNYRVTLNWDDCSPKEYADPADKPEGKLEFYLPLDTDEVGVGEVTADIYAFIPDPLFKDGHRTEIVRIESIATIIP